MKRCRLSMLVVGAMMLVALSPAPARSQSAATAVVVSPDPYRGPGIYAPPGNFGVMYGTPSYGSVRTYSEFSSPYGGGYSYGYGPSRVLPGRYGVGLWRPGFAAPGYVYGASAFSYRTFAVPYSNTPAVLTPPLGVYAPMFGPSYVGW
jgi:hypothetical protein